MDRKTVWKKQEELDEKVEESLVRVLNLYTRRVEEEWLRGGVVEEWSGRGLHLRAGVPCDGIFGDKGNNDLFRGSSDVRSEVRRRVVGASICGLVCWFAM